MADAQTCFTGKTQSPIDIFDSKTNHKLPPLKFDYRHADIKQIVNNGHSLQFNFDSNSNLTYNNKTYTLVQFHAHAPAEHTINGIRYPLELHFVHQAADHSNLVVAVFVQEGQQNFYFEKLSVFKKLAKNGSENTDIIFNPEHLYPHNHSYYRYTGSLTTPHIQALKYSDNLINIHNLCNSEVFLSSYGISLLLSLFLHNSY